MTVFLDDYPDVPSWPYLDKLICAWREEEERHRAACGIAPAAPYGRCRIFSERNQVPTQEWLDEESGLVGGSSSAGTPTESPTPAVDSPTQSPTSSPTSSPTLAPTAGGTAAPTRWELPVLFQPVFNSPSSTEEPTPEDQLAQETEPPTAATTESPTAGQSVGGAGGGTPLIDCSNFPVDYSRMCAGEFPCCQSDLRGESEFCHRLYETIFPGDLIFSACAHCCPGGPQQIAPEKPEKPGLPKTVQCAVVGLGHNIRRVCKQGSCCDGQTLGEVCSPLLGEYAADMEEICVSEML